MRGHQSRKRFRAVIWSVGILEKVILRWRRRGSGLRGFQNNGIAKGPKVQGAIAVADEDDYDFLKEGRKQTEERYRKALSRVKSMAQHPEGRDQYRRLLTAVERYCEAKVARNVIPSGFKESVDGDKELVDIETFLDDDNFMSGI